MLIYKSYYLNIRDMPNQANFLSIIKLLKPHHWIKNLIIFVPVIASHKLFQQNLICETFLGIASFSMFASVGYIFNDIIDLENDRAHPKKKGRILASKQLSIRFASQIASAAFLVGAVLAIAIHPIFFFACLIYLIGSILYSLYIKIFKFFDIVALAFFFVFRIFLGALISDIVLSAWLVTYSLCFFINLATLKRYSELLYLTDIQANIGSIYIGENLKILQSIGFFSGLCSTLIFTAYTFSAEAKQLYREPIILIMTLLLMTLWLVHLWKTAQRLKNIVDPTWFALTDKRSYLFLFFTILTTLLAI